jgi:hypothetical protein
MVVVHEHDPSFRRGPLSYFVDVVGGGEPSPDVEELADALLSGQVPDHATEERTVLPRRSAPGWHGGPGFLRHFPVDRDVVLAAKAVVVDPGWVRARRIDLRWQLRHSAPPRFATEAYRPVHIVKRPPEIDTARCHLPGTARTRT